MLGRVTGDRVSAEIRKFNRHRMFGVFGRHRSDRHPYRDRRGKPDTAKELPTDYRASSRPYRVRRRGARCDHEQMISLTLLAIHPAQSRSLYSPNRAGTLDRAFDLLKR
jgi:hypothetical protein